MRPQKQNDLYSGREGVGLGPGLRGSAFHFVTKEVTCVDCSDFELKVRLYLKLGLEVPPVPLTASKAVLMF